MVIDNDCSSDEYKEVRCFISSEECTTSSCRFCRTARDHLSETEAEEKARSMKHLTSFEIPWVLYGFAVKVNIEHTISIMDSDIVPKLSTAQISKTEVAFDRRGLGQYPRFFDLKEALGLGTPERVFAELNCTAIFQYGAVSYLAAPRISEEQ